jgi:hypothetical protein
MDPITFRRQRLARAIALVLAAAPLALVTTGAQAQFVDLGDLAGQGFRIGGIDESDQSGVSVSGAGDVNGDGFADVIVGAELARPGGDTFAGESYVVFGKPDGTPVDLANLGAGGFRIDGIDPLDRSGGSVSGAGDVNGDGLADLIIGAREADPGGDGIAGESYVVFGKTDGTTVDLAALGSNGFRIDGSAPGDQSGRSVSGAGDVNGDGLDDLVVGANVAGGGFGEAYVVFGKADTATVDLASLGTGGFRVLGFAAGDYAGRSVSGAGDVNGDGLADLVVGARGADPGGDDSAGSAFVVFGKPDSTAVDVGNLGAAGFRIDGIDIFDYAGDSVASAGDVNGDGLADLIVGAYRAAPGGNPFAGEAYVVFGKANGTTVDLANLGTGGFRIDGGASYDLAGISVAAAGDVDGDGLGDVLVGASNASNGAEASVGRSYVVYGKAGNTTIDLANIDSNGFVIQGEAAGDAAGTSVSGAGDVDGDGMADLIIGASGANVGSQADAGASYVVFSRLVPRLSSVYRARSANGNPTRTALGDNGDGSNHGTPDARVWIDFADGNDPVAAASTETATLTRNSGVFPAPGAGVSWRLQTTRQNWTSAEVKFRYVDGERLVDENLLQVYFSPDGQAPYSALTSVLNPLDNTITANITQMGFFYLGQGVAQPDIFANGFE